MPFIPWLQHQMWSDINLLGRFWTWAFVTFCRTWRLKVKNSFIDEENTKKKLLKSDETTESLECVESHWVFEHPSLRVMREWIIGVYLTQKLFGNKLQRKNRRNHNYPLKSTKSESLFLIYKKVRVMSESFNSLCREGLDEMFSPALCLCTQNSTESQCNGFDLSVRSRSVCCSSVKRGGVGHLFVLEMFSSLTGMLCWLKTIWDSKLSSNCSSSHTTSPWGRGCWFLTGQTLGYTAVGGNVIITHIFLKDFPPRGEMLTRTNHSIHEVCAYSDDFIVSPFWRVFILHWAVVSVLCRLMDFWARDIHRTSPRSAHVAPENWLLHCKVTEA